MKITMIVPFYLSLFNCKLLTQLEFFSRKKREKWEKKGSRICLAFAFITQAQTEDKKWNFWNGRL